MFFYRKYRYLKNQQGIIHRYIREGSNWEEHLEKTRQFILRSAKNTNKDLAVILGSGWLLDIPLEWLSGNFQEVHLVDMLHPRQIVNRVKSYANVHTCEKDLLDIPDSQWLDDRSEIHHPALKEYIAQADYVVSANLLTQLEIPLIRKHAKELDRPAQRNLSKRVQEYHTGMLPAGKTCLVTEYSELLYTEQHEFEAENPLLFIDLPEATDDETWLWAFDTRMTYYPNRKRYLKIRALTL